jgi:carbon storage regulator
VLTLTRTIGETIRIGDDIEVHVVEVRGNTVRLGFKAPREVSIHREEVYEQIAAARRLAVRVAADAVGALTAALGGTRGSAAGTPAVSATSDTAARSSA